MKVGLWLLYRFYQHDPVSLHGIGSEIMKRIFINAFMGILNATISVSTDKIRGSRPCY